MKNKVPFCGDSAALKRYSLSCIFSAHEKTLVSKGFLRVAGGIRTPDPLDHKKVVGVSVTKGPVCTFEPQNHTFCKSLQEKELTVRTYPLSQARFCQPGGETAHF